MIETVISVKNLTKTFKLYNFPKDRLKEALSPFRKKYHNEFFAINDISFEVKKGESIGILGKNGAGKSTLLKILTGVLTPSAGEVNVSGRIAALLELGSGFNPELSGMENIYFQGAITGFTKEEIELKIPEIIEFADIGEFINQPVKTYSSGMFARLAFSIAINVDPDILIVDEALSVGDMRFQQKCLRKMSEFSQNGKVVIFVSHDIGLIKRFCTKALWIKDSKIELFEDAQSACDKYYSWISYDALTANISRAQCSYGSFANPNDWRSVGGTKSFGDKGAEIIAYQILNLSSKSETTIKEGDEILLRFKIITNRVITSPGIGIILRDRLGSNVFTINNYIYNKPFYSWGKDVQKVVEIKFKFPPLGNGDFALTVAISDGDHSVHSQEHWIHDLVVLQIYNPGLIYNTGCILALSSHVDFNCSEM